MAVGGSGHKETAPVFFLGPLAVRSDSSLPAGALGDARLSITLASLGDRFLSWVKQKRKWLKQWLI